MLTGLPSRVAGSYFQVFTAAIALSVSSSGRDLIGRTRVTSPFLSMMASRMTVPWIRASLAISLYCGASPDNLTGFMTSSRTCMTGVFSSVSASFS